MQFGALISIRKVSAKELLCWRRPSRVVFSVHARALSITPVVLSKVSRIKLLLKLSALLKTSDELNQRTFLTNFEFSLVYPPGVWQKLASSISNQNSVWLTYFYMCRVRGELNINARVLWMYLCFPLCSRGKLEDSQSEQSSLTDVRSNWVRFLVLGNVHKLRKGRLFLVPISPPVCFEGGENCVFFERAIVDQFWPSTALRLCVWEFSFIKG